MHGACGLRCDAWPNQVPSQVKSWPSRLPHAQPAPACNPHRSAVRYRQVPPECDGSDVGRVTDAACSRGRDKRSASRGSAHNHACGNQRTPSGWCGRPNECAGPAGSSRAEEVRTITLVETRGRRQDGAAVQRSVRVLPGPPSTQVCCKITGKGQLPHCGSGPAPPESP